MTFDLGAVKSQLARGPATLVPSVAPLRESWLRVGEGPVRVQTDEPSPYCDALARSIASSSPPTFQIGSAGPNTSSTATFESCGGSRISVGS